MFYRIGMPISELPDEPEVLAAEPFSAFDVLWFQMPS